MKNGIYLGVLALCLPFGLSAYTADNTFTSQTESVVNYVDYGISEFTIGITGTPKDIAYWKVRTYCDETMGLGVNTVSDTCNTATVISGEAENFALFFKNSGQALKRFSFKLKAYDINGKWIDTIKQSFSWK